ncbi:hypothetical protein [Janthinobacterium lividum]|uniref:Uncharacterized protein n=1 Tax=Janthinobacterium lividum TaxID=29581 RepID=A0ABU0Y228_9BURK|nr:hypothetical protein [Janthinobacterium lividum]MDQ4629877.1 hypothetical protein [Janthinobacterium lividum]MDQ4678010.1 hypothetical protein [Janthinobacterium lividum]MDQ4688126.1 hypothetical protein [Janthinobacterium lividum]
MRNDKRDRIEKSLQPLLSGRRSVLGLIGLGALMPLAAFGQKNKTTKKAAPALGGVRRQEVCRECLQKRAKQRSAFVNKGPQR